jgi:hypothetical protein
MLLSMTSSLPLQPVNFLVERFGMGTLLERQ